MNMFEEAERIREILDGQSEFTKYFEDGSCYKASDKQIQEYILFEINELDNRKVNMKRQGFRKYLIDYYQTLGISETRWSKNLNYLYKNDYIKISTRYKTKPYVEKGSAYYLPKVRSYGMSPAEMVFEICMGDNPQLRKRFIEDNSQFVNVDI